jgi:hypothetical protein
VPSIQGQFAQFDLARPSVVSRIILVSWGSTVDVPVRFEFRRKWNLGRSDSRGGNLVHRYGTKPFPGVRKCVKIFELDAHFLRLRIGNEIRGRIMWAPNQTGSARQGASGQANQARREVSCVLI